jgi:hypothetical protein
MKPIPRPPAARAGRPPTAQTAAAVIATTVLVLLAAACGGGSPSPAGSGGSSDAARSPNAGGSTTSPSAVAYSACMRSHGVPNYPDPESDGGIPKGDAQQFGVSTSQFQAAQHACQPVLPTGGAFDQQAQQCFVAGNCPPALVQQILTVQRNFAQCMRSRGFPKFPDPTIDSQGRPVFAWSISQTGIDPHSSQYETEEDQCQRLAPAPEARAVDP